MPVDTNIIPLFKSLLSNFKNYKNYKEIRIDSIDDIKKIPITTRDDINNFRYADCPVEPRWIRNTSGSTGAPTLFYFSRESVDYFFKRGCKFVRELGIADHIIFSVIEDLANCFFSVNINGPLLYSALGTNWSKQLAIIKIQRIRPDIIIAPPNIVLEFMKEIKDKTIFKKIILAGTVVPDAFKDEIKKATEAEVVLLYACTETGILGFQKKEGKESMLLSNDGLYLEVLADNGQASEYGKGRLLITDLYNYSMPLIRYDIGDLVEIYSKDGTKYIEIFGKIGGNIKINNDVSSKAYISSQMIKILGNDNFLIEVHCNNKTLKDYLIVKIPEEKIDYKNRIIEEFSEFYGVDIIVEVLKEEIKKNLRYKPMNIIDCRMTEKEQRSKTFGATI